ncbi:hypothetical protein GCM10027020_27280 [Nocardioides salsibiostraticola]
MLSNNHGVVSETLTRLEERLRARDVEGAVACFMPNGAIYGKDVGEQAHGAAELRALFGGLVACEETIGWDLAETHVRSSAGSVWFVADASLVVRGPNGVEPQQHPFWMSGILRGHHGFWRFELFNGTMPLIGSRPESSPSPSPSPAPAPVLRLVTSENIESGARVS